MQSLLCNSPPEMRGFEVLRLPLLTLKTLDFRSIQRDSCSCKTDFAQEIENETNHQTS